MTVLRYIELNPLRAGLVAWANNWLWSSLWGCEGKISDAGLWMHEPPSPLPRDWMRWVNEPMTEAEVERLRQSANRGTLFGSEA